MKNLYLFVFTICCAITNLQAQNFTQVWKKLANGTDYSWFNGTDNGVTSLAFNPVTNKLLVSKRAVGIYIVNPTTGAVEDSLKLQGIGTEGLRHNKIRVSSDGAIYGISLATAPGTTKIYRWATQADTPTVCATLNVTERCGDAFGLSGAGNNTVLYASGAGLTPTTNAYNIYILNTTNGKDFNLESKVVLNSTPAGLAWANRVVEPDGTGVDAPLWINGGGFNARKLTISAKDGSGIRSGTVVTTIEDGVGSGQASLGYGGTRLFTNAANKKFLVLAGGNNAYAATKMTVINVTAETAPITFAVDSFNTQASYVTNGNGTGDVSFKDNGNNSFTVFQLSTNNGIAAFTSRIITDVKDVSATNGFSVQTLNNPVNNDLNIRINAASERKITVNIVNIIGRILITKQVTVSAGANTFGFAMGHLPVGLYLVNINDGQSQKTVKIVKQ